MMKMRIASPSCVCWALGEPADGDDDAADYNRNDGDDDDDDEKFCISFVCWVLCEASDDDGASDDNKDFLTIILSQ